MRVFVAVIVAVGCSSTHHSTLPPYARDLRPAHGGGLEVVSCEMVLTVTENRGWYNSSTETELNQGRCWRVVVPTAVGQYPMQAQPQPLPPAVTR